MTVIGTHDLLSAILDKLDAIDRRLADVVLAQGVSSVQIEDAAKGPPRITTKQYRHDELSLGELANALTLHGFARREAERRMLDGWQETVDELRDREVEAF